MCQKKCRMYQASVAAVFECGVADANKIIVFPAAHDAPRTTASRGVTIFREDPYD